MTLNAAFKTDDGVPLMISDHLVTHSYGPNSLIRKSTLISPQLVVAGSGCGYSAIKIIERLQDSFARKMVRKADLLANFLCKTDDLMDDPCVLVGWLIEGRKQPFSFRWDSRQPGNPRVEANFIEGSGAGIYQLVIPQYESDIRGSYSGALSFAIAKTAALWINDILLGATARHNFGAGYDIFVFDPHAHEFRLIDDVGFTYFRLSSLNDQVFGIEQQLLYEKISYLENFALLHRISGSSIARAVVDPVVRSSPAPDIDNINLPLTACAYGCCFLSYTVSGTPLLHVCVALGSEAIDFKIYRTGRIQNGYEEYRIESPKKIIDGMASTAVRSFREQGYFDILK